MNWNRVTGWMGSENLELLSHKRVAIVGLGSGGGFVALALAMCGVKHFMLVDDDTLEEANLSRHVCDRRYIGQNKAVAVADLIFHRDPEIDVEVYEGRIEEHIDILDQVDLLVVGVDNENVKYFLNEACLQRRLSAVYAGVYERGEGGDVVLIQPYDGPCYACWAQSLRVSSQKPADADLDYGMIGEAGTIEAEPALWLHVTKVASVQADLCLNYLLRGTTVSEEMPANTIVIANNTLEILAGELNDPHTAVWVNIARDPACLVCGEKMRLTDDEAESLSLSSLSQDTDMIFEESDEA